MNKTTLNYWLDVVIGLAFVVAAVTGIVFLFIGSAAIKEGETMPTR